MGVVGPEGPVNAGDLGGRAVGVKQGGKPPRALFPATAPSSRAHDKTERLSPTQVRASNPFSPITV